MKRLLPVLLLMLVLALSGCSAGTASEASAASVSASASASEIQTSAQQTQSADNQTAEVPEIEVSSVTEPEESPLEEIQSVNTPEETAPVEVAPQSLREILPKGAVVKTDGAAFDGLNAGGVTLVPDTALMEAYPWLQRNMDGEFPAYCDRSGNPVELSWSTATGDDFVYPGSGAVCFSESGTETEYWLPVRELTEKLGLQLLWDEEWNEIFITEPVDTASVQLGASVPVLMYHETSDDLWGITSLFVSPDNLRQQLQYLQDNGYDPIFFSDLTHLEDYDKPVLLTFDDGYIGNYTYLYPLLQEFNMKATIFVISGMVGDEHYMTVEQIKELSDSGLVDIESHTQHHYELATLSADEQRHEMEQSRLEIARITGKVPYVLAYPTGSNDANTRAIGPEYYTFGVLMNGGVWNISGDWFGVTRSYVNRSTDLTGFAALLG